MNGAHLGQAYRTSRLTLTLTLILTGRRPDGLIFSDKLKKVVWIELTSPWEENLTKSYTCKKAKYNKLEKLVKASDWTVVSLYVEVGSRTARPSKQPEAYP